LAHATADIFSMVAFLTIDWIKVASQPNLEATHAPAAILD
jgi:hypothetical protein